MSWSHDCECNSWWSMWWVRMCCFWRRLQEAVKPDGHPLSFYVSQFLSRLSKTTMRTWSAGWPNLIFTPHTGQSLITIVLWSPYEALARHPGDPPTPPQGPSVTWECLLTDWKEEVLHIFGASSSPSAHSYFSFPLAGSYPLLTRITALPFQSWTRRKSKVVFSPASWPEDLQFVKSELWCQKDVTD